MKFFRTAAKQRKFISKRATARAESIEDYGRDQLKKLAEKGLSFQIVVL